MMSRIYHFQKFAVSQEDKEKIKNFYLNGFERGDGKLDKFCAEIGRHKATVVKIAQENGLSTLKRKACDKYKILIGKERKEWIKENGHPKGMLGKKHSKEYCEILRERHKNSWKNLSEDEITLRLKKTFSTKLRKYGTLSPFLPGKPVSWKQGWREVGGRKIFFRSRWEANYGRYLEFLKTRGDIKEWLHEPQTFWFPNIKRGTLTYLPDFKVINNDGSHYWVEVKGYYDKRSKTKIRRFRKNFKEEKLVLIDSVWFKKNSKNMSIVIKDWEFDRS